MALLASPAWAAKVLETRVGVHDEYTRIVFELDTPAGYQIERQASADGGSELIVSLDARAQAVNLPASKSRVVSSVDVSDSGSTSVARIRLSADRVRLKEMILANPPRIVLDVMAEQPAPVAKAPAPVKSQASAPVKSQASASAKASAPAVAKAPVPAIPDLTDDAFEDVDVTEEIEEFSAGQVPDLADEPSKDVAAAPTDSEFKGADAPASPAPSAGMKPVPSPASPQKLAMANSPKPSAARPAAASKPPAAAPRAEPRPLPRAPRKLPPIPAAAPPPAKSEGLFGYDMKTMGAAAVGLIALVGAGGLLMRRRGRSDEMEEDLSGADPFAGFDTPADDAGAANAETQLIDVDDDDLPAPIHDDAPVVKGAAMPGLAPAAKSGFGESDDSEAPTQAVTAIGGQDDLFGSAETETVETITAEGPEASESAATVVLNVPDLPGDEKDAAVKSPTLSDFETVAKFDAPSAAAAAPAASRSQGPEAQREVEELERRLAQTETRLDEALESAERLERKVAAQTEELRVQRAAIARTQRAVRNLSRGEDDSSATEPAPKGPAQ